MKTITLFEESADLARTMEEKLQAITFAEAAKVQQKELGLIQYWLKRFKKLLAKLHLNRFNVNSKHKLKNFFRRRQKLVTSRLNDKGESSNDIDISL